MAGAVLGLVLADRGCDLGNGMFDREPSCGEIYAVPFEPQDFAPAQAVQSGDLHKGIDRIVPDRVKQGFELVGAVVAGFIPLLLRKLDELTGIRRPFRLCGLLLPFHRKRLADRIG